MSLVLVHLSDIHIENKEDYILRRSKGVAQAIYRHASSESKVVLVVSGDIANKGSEEQYQLAEEFLLEIRDAIESEKEINVEVVVCPGNHDCQFGNDAARSFMIDKIIEDNVETVKEEVLMSCVNHQNEYFKFEKRVSGEITGDNLWRHKEIIYEEKKISFESINLSWCSKIRECQGELVFPFEKYSKKMLNDECDYRILFMHHPINWLLHSSARSFRNSVRPLCSMVFTGHEHVPNAVDYSDIESGNTSNFEAPVLQDRKTNESGFSIVDFDVSNGSHKYSIYAYDSDSEMYIANQVRTMNEQDGFNKSLCFNSVFLEKIEDCGAYFRNSNTSNLRLSDIFVYPELKIKGKDEAGAKSDYISSENLKNPRDYARGIILSGDDNCGSSSLLYSLMIEYLNLGYMPVLLRGLDFKKATSENIDHQIKKAVKLQYRQENAFEIFEQKEKSKKIILIDDFNETKIKSSKAREVIFNHLFDISDKVLITVDKFFEVGELMAKSRSSIFSTFTLKSSFIAACNDIRTFFLEHQIYTVFFCTLTQFNGSML